MNVSDRDRFPVFETNHLAALPEDLVDQRPEIDLPHAITSMARHNNRDILGQHHQNAQVEMIDILVGNKHSIEAWQLGR